MPVSDIDEFKGHIGCPFHRVFIPAGGAKTAMAAKRNKFHLSAVRAAIHGSTEGWIATIDHLVHVFDYGSTWMEDINHFFVMVCKDFLKDIHMNIIEEMDGKKKPHPSRLRGRGVEVSKTLCSTICLTYISESPGQAPEKHRSILFPGEQLFFLLPIDLLGK